MTPQKILQFWFGDIKDGWTTQDRRALWFGGNPDDDADIRRQFSETLAAGRSGKLDEWKVSPQGSLAFIILLDQITRVTGRGTPAAFAGDAAALTVCKTGLADKTDQQLPAVCRSFFYLPLEHSEALADQEQGVLLFQKLRAEHPPFAAQLDDALQYAVKHRDIIKQFGRFPHRNDILRRPSTAEEIVYLQSTKERFGQKSAK